MDQPFEKLKDQFEKIPEDVRLAISSVRVADALQEIGEKYQLHIDVTGKLFDETGAIMLGLTHPSDYTKNLKKSLRVDEKKAKEIASDVNEQIFRPIRESLKKIHDINDDTPPEMQKTTSEEIAPQKKMSMTQAPGNLPVAEGGEPSASAPIQKRDGEKEDTLDREQILREIEEPEEYHKKRTPQEKETPHHGGENIIKEKLSGTFKIPRHESEHRKIPTEDNEKVENKYTEGDPYREPLE